jgi:hypothetical protein
MAGNVSYGSLPFSEQIAFFRRKFNTKTDAWTDVYGSAHDNEFMVAGANRDALLADLRTAVEKSLDGGTLETFRKDFAAIVAGMAGVITAALSGAPALFTKRTCAALTWPGATSS